MKDVGSGSQCVKKDGVKRVTMMPVIKNTDVIGVETQVYGAVCVAVVKKIEKSRDVIEIGTTVGRKRIHSLYIFFTLPHPSLREQNERNSSSI